MLARYFRVIGDALGLRDWEFILTHSVEAADPALAHVSTVYGRRTAEITFADQFLDSDPDEVRLTTVHELIHVHFDAIRHLMDKALKEHLGAGAWNVWVEASGQRLEEGVDALATAIAPLMPEFPGWDG